MTLPPHHLLRALLVVALGLALAGCQGPRPPLYGHAKVGWSIADDSDHGPGVSSRTHPGIAVSGAFGAQFHPRVRAEVEVAYQEFELRNFKVNGAQSAAEGDKFAFALMGNGFLDFPNRSAWTPYLGAGAGVAWVGYKDVDVFGGRFVDDKDAVFALQAMVGTRVKIDDHVSVSLGYRLLVTENPVLTDELDRRFDDEFLSHSLDLGLEVRF